VRNRGSIGSRHVPVGKAPLPRATLVGLFLATLCRFVWSESIQISGNQSNFVTTCEWPSSARAPFQLRKAIVAAHGGRRISASANWSAHVPGPGIPTRVLSRPIPLNGPWQVQLMNKDGVAPVMWGYAQHFASN